MILFLFRVLLCSCVLTGMTLVWVAVLDTDDEGFQRALDRNATLLLGYLTQK